MLHGVDVSNFQGAFPWSGGEGFGFAKATEGTFFRDPFFGHNWSVMGSKEILRGAYHFAHPGTSASAQASFFVSVVQGNGLHEFDVLALDLEVSDGLPAARVAAWAVEFCTAVEKATGKNVWIYTPHSFINGGFCEGLFSHPLWIADPSAAEGHPSGVHPWQVWTVHQYAAKNGVDQDVLNGDAAVWRELANLVQVVRFKTVTASWVCEGQSSLVDLCATRFNSTSVAGVGASTVLRLTLDNSPHQVFAPDLAAYVSAGDLLHARVPRGVVLFYPKVVKG